jgi:hypothetical protein
VKGFAKIYSTILDSSVWGESKDVKLLWITMLAMGGEHGLVEASLGGLARRAGLTREECEVALAVLSAPDPDDSSGVDEGRRISKTERGWRITNHRYYRDFRTEKQIEGAERVKKFRAKERNATSVTGNDVTPGNATSRSDSTEADPEAERDQETPPPKDLTGCSDPLPVVVVPQSAESKVACPADLRLTEAQRQTLITGAIPEWALEPLERRFVANQTADPSDRRTLVVWRKCLGVYVTRTWNNPRQRPPAPGAPERDSEIRLRVARGTRQPNATDHSDPEQHFATIGATEV